MHKHILAVFVLVFLLVIAGTFWRDTARPAVAATGDLVGWAWSSNTGWISMNCANSQGFTPPIAECGTAPYAVNIPLPVPPAGSLVSGFAWSSTLGWITFEQANKRPDGNDLRNCPGTPCEARLLSAVNGVNQLVGWAKVINAKDTNGWDGFISLSPQANTAVPEVNDPSGSPLYDPGATCTGTPPPAGMPGCYGVRLNPATNRFSGFAWGGDVVGWVSFAPSNSLPVQIQGAVITTFTAGAPSGGSTRLRWTTQAGTATSCTRSSDDPASTWNNASGATSGDLLIPITRTTRYALTCDPGGATLSRTVLIGPIGATLGFSASPTSASVSFVSEKQETTTKIRVTIPSLVGYTGPVAVRVIPPPDPNTCGGPCFGTAVKARFTTPTNEQRTVTDALRTNWPESVSIPAGKTTETVYDVYITFDKALGSGVYIFTIEASGNAVDFGSAKTISIPIRVQSFKPVPKEIAPPATTPVNR